MTGIVFGLNAILGLATAVISLVAAVRPASLSRSAAPSPGEKYYAQMYALRATPLGILAGVAPFLGSSGLAVAILAGAAVAQVGDAGLGVARREPGMIAGGAIAALIHVVAAVLCA